MLFSVISDAKETSDLFHTVVVPYWQGTTPLSAAGDIDKSMHVVTTALNAKDFSAKKGELLFLYPDQGVYKRVVLVGLGKEADCDTESLRCAFAALARGLQAKKVSHAAVYFPQHSSLHFDMLAEACAEGFLLGNYLFTHAKKQPEEDRTTLVEAICWIGGNQQTGRLLQRKQTLAKGIYLARDLVMGNADDVTPPFLGEKAKELAARYPALQVTVMPGREIQEQKMGLFAAVMRGSSVDGACILIEYRGNKKSDEWSAIVGKGITFDTGGLNLKPTGYMETMRTDMAGAAAVLGTMQTLAELGIEQNVIGAIGATENAIGPKSYKPGDVYESYSGLAVEIDNTDAEGRLVLADVLSLVIKKYAPKRVIDLATLTGAIVVALGEKVAGLFCNDDTLANQLMDSAHRSDDRLCRLPLVKEYNKLLESKIADIKSCGGRKAGSITAALFIQHFVEKTPWAHLDIAGTAFPDDTSSCHPSRATGFGVRLLVDFFDRMR